MDLKIKTGDPRTMQNWGKLFGSVSSFSAGRQKVGANRDNLKRWKAASGMDSLQVIPMMLHVPFNPDTGEELPVAMPITLSIRTAISYLKYRASTIPAVKQALLTAINATEDEIDFEHIDVVTDAEYNKFKVMRNILVYGATVMSAKDPQSKLPYGSTYRVDLQYDDETGNVIDSPRNPLIYQVYQMEAAAIATQVQVLRSRNEQAGANRRTEKEMEDMVSNLWKNRVFSNPYFLGTTRILEIPTDKSYMATETVTKAWVPGVEALRKLECYIKVNGNIRDALESIINTRYDSREDYLLVKIHVPEFDDNTRMTAYQAISRSGAGRDEDLNEMLNKFDEVYRDFRDNQDMWDEKFIKSIYEYRRISDDQVTAFMRAKMPELQEYIKTPDILNKYQDLIAQIDEKMSAELLTATLTGDTNPAVDYQEALSQQPTVNENTPGYGGDTMGEVVVGIGATDADREALQNAADPMASLTAAMNLKM